MKNKFLSFLIVTCAFLIGVTSSAWAADDQPVYLVSLKAQSASQSAVDAGAGEVQLTLIDIHGEGFDNSLATNLNGGRYDTDMGNTAQIIGGTLIAAESVESDLIKMGDHVFVTPFAYFKADAQGVPGSYLYDWTFTEAAITRQDTAMDKSHPESAYFKVLADTVNKGYMRNGTTPDIAAAYANVQANPNNIYAVFKKYILSNPVVKNNGSVGTAEGSQATIDVSVDIEGDMSQLKPGYADFALPMTTFYQNEDVAWSWALAANPSEILNPQKGRAHLVITVTTKKAIAEGTYKATLPVSMQGTNPSALNIPLTVLARPVSANEASVRIGDADPVEYPTLAQAVSAANGASGDVVLTLLKDVAVSSSVVLTNTMTLDLNGYTLSAANAIGMVGQPVLKINADGKTVTLAYNKQGGAIQAAPAVGGFGVMGGLGVEVAAGTLVLNGGTIASENALTTYGEAAQTAAVKVDADATLIQDGATITATSAGPNAFGIYNEGTVIIRDGSVRAEAGFNNAMAVYALDGSTTTIDGGSLSALAKEEDGTCEFNGNLTPAAIATWTNAYAVHVAAGSTVTVNGGDLYAEATNADRAYAVSALAGFGGTLTVNKGATVRAKSPNNMFSFPVAIMAGSITINGGRFDGKYTDNTSGETNNPAVFGVDYSNFTFKSGTCQTEKFFTEDDRFETSFDHPTYRNYSVVKGSQDYIDGYRYIAVADNANPAEFVPACRIGSTGYPSLKAALSYANNYPEEELIIFMLRDEVLPAGYYTLPKKATLVIPMSDSQAKEANPVCPRVVSNDADRIDYEVPTEYRRLTFASGVNMEVHGQIEMTGTQFSTNKAYNSYPHGPYGRLVMEEGSHMTLSEGAELRAWGYMTGKGETDARRGATVREMFQMGDWKGAFTSVAITGLVPSDFPLNVGDYSDKKIFPVTQYFIQNVESPVKYHPGAVLSTCATVSEGISLGGNKKINIAMAAPDIKIIGLNEDDEAIFLMDRGADADNTWVRKWYDVDRDVQTYEINSGANIGSMVIDMKELSLMGYTLPVKLNSAKFDLPITNNMKIHLLSGSMGFEQNTCLLPGANVEVDKEARVTVSMSDEEYEAKQNNDEDRVYYTGALYVFGKEDWDTYAYDPEGSTYTKVVNYSPSWADKGAENGRPTVRLGAISNLTQFNDTAIFVHGTFDTEKGYVYSSEHAVNIYSTDADAGTFIFSDNASEAGERTVYQINGIGNSQDQYIPITFTSVKLRNGNGEPAPTEEAKADDAYCYMDGKWTILKVVDDNYCFMKDNYDTYYAKPSEYVALDAKMENNKIVGNKDHTYSDANGAGRLFILKDNGCQWWEVVLKDSLYYCEKNDMYYYYDNSEKDWMEKTCLITWKNYNDTIIPTAESDGTLVNSYYVPYGTIAEFNGLANPTRANDIDSTYSFVGWQPELGKVTGDVTYTAVFSASPREYTITFCENGGKLIESHLVPYGEVPVCENVPSQKGYILQWEPALRPVIGTQTYTATWIEELPETYPVSFVNNDGTLLKKTGGIEDAVYEVRLDAEPSVIYDGATPEKAFTSAAEETELTTENVYTFTGWRAIIDGEARDFAPTDVLPAPTAPTIYTAQYASQRRPYTIKFVKENGNPAVAGDVLETLVLPYGATPLCSKTPTKANTAEWSYSFAWTPQIQTVVGDANYKATFTPTKNKYTLTLLSNNDAVCAFTGAGTYDYNADDHAVQISVVPNLGYEFVKWQIKNGDVYEDITEPANFTTSITVNKTYRAVIKEQNLVVGLNEGVEVKKPTTVPNLILQASAGESGQLLKAENLTVTGNAYFDLTLNTDARHWHAFGVPWAVDLDATPLTEVESGRTLVLGRDYDIIWYNTAKRASQGAGSHCWEYVEHNAHILTPGQGYMIAFTSHVNTIRFAKATGTPVLFTGTVNVSGAGSGADQGINAIANPMAYHASMNAGPTVGYVHDGGEIGSDGYDEYDINGKSFIVGKAVYVQVNNTSTVDVNPSSAAPISPVAAPARRTAKATDKEYLSLSDYYHVSIANETTKGGSVYVLPEEDKEDQYIIGHDLSKFGMSTKKPQIWIKRYDVNLGLNTTAPMDGVAEFPVNIYAPKAGQYTLSLVSEPDDEYAVYLTLNGEAIWNLSSSEYAVELAAGTNKSYGLRLSARKSPSVATGVDEAVVDAQGEIKKVIINDKVFIIRGENVYTIDGQLVK